MSIKTGRSGVIQVLMLDVLRPDLTGWLNDRGLMLIPMPEDLTAEDDFPTFLVSPTQELMNLMVKSEET